MELNLANQEARQARDLFYTLFHSNPLPTAITRLEDGFIIDVNEAYLEYFGLKREQVIDHLAAELRLPIDPDLRPNLIARLQEEGAIHDIELQIIHPSGEARIILLSIQARQIDNTNLIIQTFTDITDRVEAEQQIRSLASDLTVAEQEERRRISQILHDDLQQRIFAVKMQTSVLLDAYRRNNLQSVQVDFEQLEELMNEAIAITRNLSIDLSPAVLQGEGLIDALGWLSAQMYEQYGLKVTLQTDGVSSRFEDTLRILLFQAVRESLFNIVKHADTLQALVQMEEEDGHTRIIVSDEGRGFKLEDLNGGTKAAGGLMNIRNRLNLMGCDLHVQSQPGKGTQVIIDVPLNRAGT